VQPHRPLSVWSHESGFKCSVAKPHYSHFVVSAVLSHTPVCSWITALCHLKIFGVFRNVSRQTLDYISDNFELNVNELLIIFIF
jgi:hypothetical protein